ncbi:MAG: PHP domain-containing protein, partial [Verrucomicrobiota bacterium]
MPLIRLLAVCGLAASAVLSAAEEAKWYKGNLHTHTYWSDGDDFPEMVADWYKSHGYDFLALSDHNIIADHDKWLKVH